MVNGYTCVLVLNIAVAAHVVEHQVSREDARLSAQTLQPELYERRPGCEDCTAEELKYCSGTDLLEDHCCCDRRHIENFPYIPHTCILKPLCRVQAGDCARYTRLRVCCCDRLTAQMWKSEASQPVTSWRTFRLCSIVFILQYYVNKLIYFYYSC